MELGLVYYNNPLVPEHKLPDWCKKWCYNTRKVCWGWIWDWNLFPDDMSCPKWFKILYGLIRPDGSYYSDEEVDDYFEFWKEVEQNWRKNNPKMSHYEARKAYGLIRDKPESARKKIDREELLSKIDMKALISLICPGEHKEYGNRIGVKCPFHDDKTMSMMVYADKKRWWCYACNEGGTAFDLIMKAEDLNFIQAMTRLDEMF